MARFTRLPWFLLLLVLLNGCATIPFDYPRQVSTAFSRPETTPMGRSIQAQVVRHHGASGFYFLTTGVDAFMARVLSMGAAEKTIDLQYYLFYDDLTGKFMLDRILAAAERGVRVRLLLDDFPEDEARERWLSIIQSHPNIHVRIFNPYGGLRWNPLNRYFQMVIGPERLQGRMHNKVFIVDNDIAIVGGRNIADEYFGAGGQFNFRDLDVMAIGPIVRKVSAVFDDYWNCALSIPLEALVRQASAEDLEEARRQLQIDLAGLRDSTYGVEMRRSDFLKRVLAMRIPFVWAHGDVVSDNPLKVIHSESKHPGKVAHRVRDLINKARTEVLIISPYFVPRQAGVQWFKQIRERGVTVKIITNSLASNDVPIAHYGYARYRKALLRLGVQLYEIRPTAGQGPDRDEEEHRLGGSSGSSSRGSLHAKAVIVDRRAVFVGSFNLDPRSAYLNTEDGIIIHSPELARQAADLFAKRSSPENAYRVKLLDDDGLVWITEENGQEVHYYHEPHSGFFRRLPWQFLALFTPESLL
jgi:cardiolipin synthase C